MPTALSPTNFSTNLKTPPFLSLPFLAKKGHRDTPHFHYPTCVNLQWSHLKKTTPALRFTRSLVELHVGQCFGTTWPGTWGILPALFVFTHFVPLIRVHLVCPGLVFLVLSLETHLPVNSMVLKPSMRHMYRAIKVLFFQIAVLTLPIFAHCCKSIGQHSQVRPW